MKKTAIIAWLVMVVSLAALAFANNVSGNSVGFCIDTMFMKQVSDGISRSPEMKQKIAEINAQIPVDTVGQWSAGKVRAASDYWQKVMRTF